MTVQSWMLLNNIRCDDDLFPIDHWTAIERTHYMGSTKVFVLVDRPFWKDKDPVTGRDSVSMTLTDRMSRGTYLLDQGEGKPGLICLSYTWSDDSLKLLALDATERMNIMLRSLEEIYPGVDFRSHVISSPVTLSWETERDFMGAFKANLPGTTATRSACSPTSCRMISNRVIGESSSPVTTCRGPPAGLRARSRPRSTRYGASSTISAALRLPRIPDPATCSRSLLRSGWATELTATAEMSCPMGVGTPIGHDLFPVIHATLESVRIQ